MVIFRESIVYVRDVRKKWSYIEYFHRVTMHRAKRTPW